MIQFRPIAPSPNSIQRQPILQPGQNQSANLACMYCRPSCSAAVILLKYSAVSLPSHTSDIMPLHQPKKIQWCRFALNLFPVVKETSLSSSHPYFPTHCHNFEKKGPCKHHSPNGVRVPIQYVQLHFYFWLFLCQLVHPINECITKGNK